MRRRSQLLLSALIGVLTGGLAGCDPEAIVPEERGIDSLVSTCSPGLAQETVRCVRALGCLVHSSGFKLTRYQVLGKEPQGAQLTVTRRCSEKSLWIVAGAVPELDNAPEGFRIARAASGWEEPRYPVPFLTQQPNPIGCTAASMAMAFHFFGVPLLANGQLASTAAVYEWFQSRWLVTGTGIRNDKVPEATNSLSGGELEATIETFSSKTDPTLGTLRGVLNDGDLGLLLVTHGKLPGAEIKSYESHMVLLVGYEGETFRYLNPWSETDGRYTIEAADLDRAMLECGAAPCLGHKVFIRIGRTP